MNSTLPSAISNPHSSALPFVYGTIRVTLDPLSSLNGIVCLNSNGMIGPSVPLPADKHRFRKNTQVLVEHKAITKANPTQPIDRPTSMNYYLITIR